MSAATLRLNGCFELENLLTFCRIPNGKIILKESETLNSSEVRKTNEITKLAVYVDFNTGMLQSQRNVFRGCHWKQKLFDLLSLFGGCMLLLLLFCVAMNEKRKNETRAISSHLAAS